MSEELYTGQRVDTGEWVKGTYMKDYPSRSKGRTFDVILVNKGDKYSRYEVNRDTVKQISGLSMDRIKYLENEIKRFKKFGCRLFEDAYKGGMNQQQIRDHQKEGMIYGTKTAFQSTMYYYNSRPVDHEFRISDAEDDEFIKLFNELNDNGEA